MSQGDEQDRAERLDADQVDPEFPPDEPAGVDEHGITPVEEVIPESFQERSAREAPPVEDAERPVVQPYSESGEDLLDEEGELVADAEIDSRDPEADAMPEAAEEAALRLQRER